jgi:hypothetical protein
MKEEFNELLEQVGEELEEEEEQALENIQETFENITNIVRFLDGKIITDLTYVTNSRGNLQVVAQYFEHSGILVYENKEPRKLEGYGKKYSEDFIEQDNIPDDKIGRLYGDEIYFTREGRFFVLTKDEIVSPSDPTKQKITLVRSQEKYIEDILREYTDFEEKFYGCFKKVIIDAIEKNPKKRGIFQKIIDYINRLESGQITDEEEEDE